jgi:hypothetical protein
MATVALRLELIQEYLASKMSRHDFRKDKDKQGILISKSRFQAWLTDFKSGRLSNEVTNKYRIPKRSIYKDIIPRTMATLVNNGELGVGKIELCTIVIPYPPFRSRSWRSTSSAWAAILAWARLRALAFSSSIWALASARDKDFVEYRFYYKCWCACLRPPTICAKNSLAYNA